jgi:mannosyltransferase
MTQFIKFLAVGGSGAAINMAVFWLTLHAFGIHYMVASTIAFLCAVTSNYYWNRVWTFNAGGREGAGVQYVQFFTVAIVALGVNLAALNALVTQFKLDAMLAQLLGIAAGTLVNFVGSKLWVFAERERPALAAGPSLKLLSVLSAIIVAAVLLRAFNLSAESLWIDEAYSVQTAQSTLTQAATTDPKNPPGYFVALHFWMKVFGTSEAGARSLSLAPSLLALILTYFLGARLYNERTGLIAAAFMAVSTFHIYFAQEARAFALLLALLMGSVLAMDVILKDNRGRGSPWAWATMVLLNIIALYTHLYAVFFVAAQSLFFVLRWRENRRKLVPWIIALAVTVLVFSPWMVKMLGEVATGPAQSRKHLLLKVPQTFFSFLAGDTLVPLDEAAKKDIVGTAKTYWRELAAAGVGFGILFLASLAAIRKYKRATVFVATMCLGPMAFAFIVSIKLKIFEERYLIACSPLLYLFLASGVAYVFGPECRRRWMRVPVVLGALLAVAVTFASLANYHWGMFGQRFGKEQWREVVVRVERRAQKQDLVVFDRGYIGRAYDYYAKREDVARLRLRDAAEDAASPEWAAALTQIKTHERVWLVRSHFDDDDVLGRLLTLFEQTNHKHFPKAKGIDVYLLSKKP